MKSKSLQTASFSLSAEGNREHQDKFSFVLKFLLQNSNLTIETGDGVIDLNITVLSPIVDSTQFIPHQFTFEAQVMTSSAKTEKEFPVSSLVSGTIDFLDNSILSTAQGYITSIPKSGWKPKNHN